MSKVIDGAFGAPDQSEKRQGWDLNPCDFGSSHRFIRPAHLAALPPWHMHNYHLKSYKANDGRFYVFIG